MAREPSAQHIGEVSNAISLTTARSLAPAAFRRWVLGAISLVVFGYLLVTLLDVRDRGWSAALLDRNALMVAVSLGALVIALRGHEVTACTMTIIASWLEVETALRLDPHFPSAGMLVLPVLVIGIGLLLGTRVAFVAMLVTIATTIGMSVTSPGLQADPITTASLYWFTMHAFSMFAVWVTLALSLSGFERVYLAMLENRQDLADTIQFAADGILVIDRRNVVTLTNPAAQSLLGLPLDQIVAHPLDSVLAATGGQREQLDALARETGPTPIELTLAYPDGAAVHIEATWRAMEGGRRQLLLRDISPRVRAEEARRAMEVQLAHAQRLDAVGRLAGGLSHDFNNILTAVSGSAEMLRYEKDPTERDELLDEIIAARDRGAALTRQLLAFARREVTSPRVIDLGEHVRGLERLLQRVAGDRQRLRFVLAEDCRVRVDPGQLEQALVNLVANARDAMPDGGWCAMTVEQGTGAMGERRVLLHVDDEGIGMSDEIALRAFEPFFTTKARGQGTGLGLASVHGMAEQSAGSARLMSQPGRGTRVTLDLPYVDEATTQPIVASITPATHTGARTVLVAEDDSGTRRIVERVLQHAGFEVTSVTDGTEAMACIEAASTPFDVVLTDVMMPGFTGPEIADRVRLLHPGTPVLLMTGYAEEQLGELIGGAFERDVITKPFSGSELVARIATLLQGQPPASSTT